MSPVADCNLTEYLDHAAHQQSHRTTLGNFFGCLAAAVDYLHQSQIRHRDIKPDNILVKSDRVYLTDFGISFNWEHLSRSTTIEESGRTLAYCAPEVAEQFQKRNSATDIWSLGCVFVEILVVRHGFGVEQIKAAFRTNSESRAFYQNTAVLNEWIYKRLQEPRPAGTGRSLSQLTLAMLSRIPEERPTASTLYHMISRFQARDTKLGNPYCGDCCLADSEAEPIQIDALRTDLTIRQKPVVMLHPALEGPEAHLETTSTAQRTHSLSYSSPRPPNNVQVPEHPSERFFLESVTPSREKASIFPLEPISLHGQVAIDPTSTVMGVSKFRRPIHPSLFETLSFQQWPIVDLHGKLPRLSSYDWTSPHTLGRAIEVDTAFMNYLLKTYPDLYVKLRQLGRDDFLPLVHLLLYNGLDLAGMRHATMSLPGSATPIMAIVIDVKSIHYSFPTWYSYGIRFSMIRLLAAFWGLDEHYSDMEAVKGLQFDKPLVLYRYRKGPLAVALNMDDMEVFKVLLDLGADPNEEYVGYKSIENRDVLTLASERGNLDAVKALDAAGVSYDRKYWNVRGREQPVVAAVRNLHEHVLSYFLETGRYTNLIEKSSYYTSERPLHLAAKMGHIGMVKTLLKYGADARAACIDEEPLTIAAKHGQLAVVKVLVEEAGVHPDSHQKNGKRALAYTQRVPDHSEVGRYLISKGAKPPTTLEKARGHIIGR
jgi:serine/threonine protein kinase